MPVPTLMFGRADAAALLNAREGWVDDDQPYNLTLRTNRIAPAGVGGECVFTRLVVVTRHREAATLTLTPLVDDTALAPITLALAAAATEQVQTHELGLSRPLVVAGRERARFRPRGTWFQVEVTTSYAADALPQGEQAIEGIELEYEVVREGQPAVNAGGAP